MFYFIIKLFRNEYISKCDSTQEKQLRIGCSRNLAELNVSGQKRENRECIEKALGVYPRGLINYQIFKDLEDEDEDDDDCEEDDDDEEEDEDDEGEDEERSKNNVAKSELSRKNQLRDILDNMFECPVHRKNFELPPSMSDEKLTEMINSLKTISSKKEMFDIWKQIRWYERNKCVLLIDELWKVYKYLGRVYKINEYYGKKEWKKSYRAFINFMADVESYFNDQFISVLEDKSTTVEEFKDFIVYSINATMVLMNRAKNGCIPILNKGMLRSSTLDLDISIIKNLGKHARRKMFVIFEKDFSTYDNAMRFI
ncbi:Phist protein (Pf-fam-b), unknown function [Plasmodium ovale wallikeri]|uniref:Plasmodium RESA N-terminal domain-containing protein n=1 Tax=Plasmodium ovale wallikeri TaxID=864142 RepID=A0A1A8YJ53_PLAOA|nr:Phist protein (Pf-fam-b), unknown function [Plasmodium ovale wallikeri]SBT59355.1 Phist protein (Pf-fam-b), unknown function [Plasmodium ovale wallikeri]